MSGFCFGHVFWVLVSAGTDCADRPCVGWGPYGMIVIFLFDNKDSVSQYINTSFLSKYPAGWMKWLRMEMM